MNDRIDARQYAPATQRNREAILAVLLEVLPSTGTVLEISSGTGEHAVFFAPHLHPRNWIPSDPNPIARESIASWQQFFPSENLHSPLDLDVTDSAWSLDRNLLERSLQAIVNINMIHIASWSACLGLMSGAGKILPAGGILYLYGPFKQGGNHTAPSNAEFDRSLRFQNPDWGVRDLEEVTSVAKAEGLSLLKVFPMSANNLSVVFQASG
ncbi:DUF938 domain-containing protein [Tumidithrix elongata]